MCAGGINDYCGYWDTVSCDKTLVCAEPLQKPEPRRPPSIYEMYGDNTPYLYLGTMGTCQRK